MWNLKKWYKWTDLQNRKTYGENKLKVYKKKGGEEINKELGLIYTY